MPELWLPAHMKQAQKRIAVVFYYNKLQDRTIVGFPDAFPIPDNFKKAGYQKVVCNTAAELDRWSQKMRDQERRDEEMTDEQREAVEGPIRSWVRGELVTKMMNARNEVNRAFCRAALQKLDDDEARRKMTKISFMHQEAFEDGR